MTTCAMCGKPLKTVKEAHAWQGELYCSEQCTLDAISDEIIMNAKETAKEIYTNEAETVSTEDIIAEEIGMTAEAILDTITVLAKHSGYYSRLVSWLNSCEPAWRDIWLKQLEAEELKSEVDLIMRLELCNE